MSDELSKVRREIPKTQNRLEAAVNANDMQLVNFYQNDLAYLRKKEDLLLNIQQHAQARALRPLSPEQAISDQVQRLLDVPEKVWNDAAGKEVVVKGEVFQVHHLHEAGRRGAKSTPAYAREEAVDLFVTVSKVLKENKNLLVTGQPECGKSLIMWQFACHVARHADCQSHQKSGVLWFRVSKFDAMVSLLTTSGIRSATLQQDDTFEDILDEVKPWLIVLDGVTVDTTRFRDIVGRWYQLHKNTQFIIIVNSSQAMVREQERAFLRAEVFWLYAWTEADLRSAFDAPEFCDSVKSLFNFSDVATQLDLDVSKLNNRDYMFYAKFALAGHSAEWMFEKAPLDLLQLINLELESAATNTLVCKLKPDSIIDIGVIVTSAYVLSHFLNRSDREEGKKFLRMLTMFSRTWGDADFDGVVLELKFRTELVGCEGSQRVITLLDADSGEEVSWGVKKLIPLEPGNSLVDLKTYLPAGDVWLMPVGSQNCPLSFDFFCINPVVSSRGDIVGVNLRVVNITRIMEYSFDFEYVRSLIKRLALAEAQQVIMCEVFIIFTSGSEQPEMTVRSGQSNCRPWKRGDFHFLQMERKKLRPMDILASLKLKGQLFSSCLGA